jgi:O-acetyl-ADP-ribose deacetylase (regulator of RNase III)
VVQKRIHDSIIIELTQGDITHQVVDAIVNAANSGLLGGGGVDGAIHRAGGPEILEECKKIRSKIGKLPTGEAVITTAGHMRAKHVIHTVGPRWKGGHDHEPELLANAYRNSLKIADEYKLKTISFPSISTGVYGYPVEHAAIIALKTVANYLKGETQIELVRFVLFDHKTFQAYKKAMAHI